MSNAAAFKSQIDKVIDGQGSTVTVTPYDSYSRDEWGTVQNHVGELTTTTNVDQLNHFNNSLTPIVGVTPTSAGTITYATGKTGSGCVVANGTDSDLNFGDVYGPNNNVASYAFWFNPTTAWTTGTAGELALIATLQAGAYEFRIGHTSGAPGKMSFIVNDVGVSNFTLSSTTDSFPADTWAHIVITHDWTTPVTKLYVNGALESSTTTAMAADGTVTSALHLFNRGGTQFWYDGKLDELVIYDKELSAAEVTALYTLQAGTTFLAVPDNIFKFNRKPMPEGIINRANTIIIAKGDASINNEDKVTYANRDYKVINIQDFQISNVSLAQEIALEELHDNT